MAITISGDTPNFSSATITTGTVTTLTAPTSTITTLNAPSGVLATQNGMTGIAKAWVNFNGGNGNTAGTINGSFNVSSITVNGTGDYTVNFTTALSSGYAPTITNGANGSGALLVGTTLPALFSNSNMRFQTAYSNGLLANTITSYVSVFSS